MTMVYNRKSYNFNFDLNLGGTRTTAFNASVLKTKHLMASGQQRLATGDNNLVHLKQADQWKLFNQEFKLSFQREVSFDIFIWLRGAIVVEKMTKLQRRTKSHGCAILNLIMMQSAMWNREAEIGTTFLRLIETILLLCLAVKKV